VVLTLGTEVGVGGPDDHRLSRRLGMLLRPVAPLVGGLVLTGGDTATGILRAWETTALRLCGEVEPGVPLSVSVAPRPLPVVTKAGAFGSTSTLTAARAALTTLLTSRGGR
jgi:4-hydroxythreonine-4-phosphate dehydrogenase